MLQVLRIESFAIIDALEIRFGPGLNVVTGETGAGKSILVGALELLLGGRADPQQIRSGCEEAVVEGLWVQEGLGERARELGLPCSDDELLVRRVIARKGRGRVYINGSLATVGLLSELTGGIVDLSGQHAQVSLLQAERHLDLLDDFGGLAARRQAYEAAYGSWASLRREREQLLAEEAERLRRRDYLEFLLREIDEVEPAQGEEEALGDERRRLGGAEKLSYLAAQAGALLQGEEGCAVDSLGLASRRVEEAARLDPALEPLALRIETMQMEAQELARELGRYASRVEADPARLAWIEERLETLQRLVRKHGGSLADLLQRHGEMKVELEGIQGADLRHQELEAEIEKAEKELGRLAAALSEGRLEAAEALSASLQQSFQDLAMGNATLEMRFHPGRGGGAESSTFGPRGAEEGEFEFAANPGEAARPLSRVASGGELSRILLALKGALAAVDPVACWIFDEIDTGIGGATALAVGRMLREAASQRQIICITHLAQVAAHADRHLEVAKEKQGGRIRSSVAELASGQRERALATMLAGDANQAALAAAAELLDGAKARPQTKQRGRGKGRGGQGAKGRPAASRSHFRPAGRKALPAGRHSR